MTDQTPRRMQMARLTPALRLAAEGVAQGGSRSIPLLLQIIDRLDRYSGPARGFQLALVVQETATPAIREARKTGGKENRRGGLGRSAAERPERTSPEQGFENAQNGKGQLLAEVGMDLGSAPLQGANGE